jgi:hypothetical protein
MTMSSRYGDFGPARANAFTAFQSAGVGAVPVSPLSWLHVCIDHKTGNGAQRLGERSP